MKIISLLVVIVLSLATLQAIQLYDESGIADESDIETEQEDTKVPKDEGEPKV